MSVHMPHRPRSRAVAAGLVAVSVLTACSTKASTNDGSEVQGVKVGVGVSDDTITIAQLTDLSGPFAPVGKAALDGNKLYFDSLNAEGGVCGKFDVQIDVKDTGYVLQNTIQQYGNVQSEALALLGTMGGPANAALLPKFEQDKIVNVPNSWSRPLTAWEGMLIPGATYDVDIANGLDYLLQEGFVAEGDAIGHIYFTGEYGEGGLAGSEAFAEQHGVDLVPIEINPTDADMSSHVSRLADKGVSAIVTSAAPGQSASVASAAAAVGFDGPILSSMPGFSEGILEGAAGDQLRRSFYVATPYQSILPADSPYLATYKEENDGATPTSVVVAGIGQAMLMAAILEKACELGDLTREGLLAAKSSLTSVDSDGLVVDLDPSLVGTPPTLSTNIQQPGETTLEPVVDGFQGETAETL